MNKLLIKNSFHPQIFFGDLNDEGLFEYKVIFYRHFNRYRIAYQHSATELNGNPTHCKLYDVQLPSYIIEDIKTHTLQLRNLNKRLPFLIFESTNLIKDNPRILRTADYLVVWEVNDYAGIKNYYTLIDNITNQKITISSSQYELNYRFPEENPTNGRYCELSEDEWKELVGDISLFKEFRHYTELTNVIARLVKLIHPMEFYTLPNDI